MLFFIGTKHKYATFYFCSPPNASNRRRIKVFPVSHIKPSDGGEESIMTNNGERYIIHRFIEHKGQNGETIVKEMTNGTQHYPK